MAPPKLDDRIRQVAILLTSVDTATARQLLTQLPTQQAKQVRQAMVQLGSVSPEERARALESFQKRNGGSQPARSDESVATKVASQSDSGVDQLELSEQAKSMAATYSVPQHPHPSAVGSSLGHSNGHGALPIDPANLPFWHDLEANDLAVILASERPTVIAVVLNQIPVELATGLLQQLPKAIALESLAKLPQLQSTPPDLLNEINQHLQERISNFQIPKKLAMQNMEKLQAILGASNPSFRTECLDRIQSQFPTLAQKLGWPPSANAVDDSIAQGIYTERQYTEHQEPHTPTKTSSNHPLSPLPRESQQSIDLRTTRQAEPNILKFPTSIDRPSIHEEPAMEEPVSRPSATVLRMSFSELETLSLSDLAKVLRASEPALILMALSGATETMYERVRSMLPQRDAKRLDEKLNRLGPIQLRDIEKAQQHLSQIATEMLADGRIGSLSNMTITAAA